MKAATGRFRSTQELGAFLKEKAAEKEYSSAKKVLVIVYTSIPGEEILNDIRKTVSHVMPEAYLAGTTHSGCNADDTEDNIFIIGSVLTFDTDAFDLYELFGPTENAYSSGKFLGTVLSGTVQPKGVLLIPSNSGNIDESFEQFLSMATIRHKDIPFFGAFAGTPGFHHFNSPPKTFTPYIFSKNAVSKTGVLCVIFKGKDLHIRTGYNYGWKPLGKTMKITGKHGNWITTLDDMPAKKIYRRYLGVDTETDNLAANVCEFPINVMRGNVPVGRIAVAGNDEGVLFASDMHLGEEASFSYGNISNMLKETLHDSEALRCFDPQAVFLFICVGRHYYLEDDAKKELSFFTRFGERVLTLYGASEILKTGNDGGELNSSLVSVGIREGEPSAEASFCSVNFDDSDIKDQTVPLTKKLINFLEATSAELAEMADEANTANQAKSDFLSRMSHEIRSPLNAILGLNEMIERESHEKRIAEYSADIKSSGRVLLSLINDILDFSKIEAGKMELIPEDYDLSSTINDLVNMTYVRAKGKGLKLITEVDEHLPVTLYGDETRLRQCILNILTNAVKYTHEGSVTFKAGFEKLDEEYILLKISVSDTGIGIKEEDLEKLTKPFERIEEGRNKNIEGTGLGMNIVTSLLSLMDSSLKVDSVYGEGSTFSFDVKQKVSDWREMGDYVARHKEVVSGELSSSNNRNALFQAPEARILAIDDTPINLQVLTGLLKRTRIICDTAESGAKAIEMANNTKYDLFLIDHMMPEMDGIETLGALRILPAYADNNTPAIALTANATSGAREMYMNAGFSGYLSKPVSGKALEKTLDSFLPEEKLLHMGDKGYIEESDDTPVSETDDKVFGDIRTLFSEKFGVDIAAGISNSGGKDIYDTVVKDFQALADARADELEKYADASDIKGFTVKVHALKSSARLVGALELSSQAAHLEECGNNGDIREIRDKLPALTGLLRKYTYLLASLAGVTLSQTDEADKPDIDPDEIEGAFLSIKDYAEAFDFDGAENIINELEKYKLPEKYRDKVKKLSEMIRNIDRDGLLNSL